MVSTYFGIRVTIDLDPNNLPGSISDGDFVPERLLSSLIYSYLIYFLCPCRFNGPRCISSTTRLFRQTSVLEVSQEGSRDGLP